VFETNGFKFDAGPTVITAPFLLDELFKLAGKKMEDYFRLVPLHPFYRIFNHEGKFFEYNDDTEFTLSKLKNGILPIKTVTLSSSKLPGRFSRKGLLSLPISRF
jgi:phytoene dehydrogenase-like protein